MHRSSLPRRPLFSTLIILSFLPVLAVHPQTLDGSTAALQDLSSQEQFQDLFNRDQGKPRIVLLLSPT